MDIKKYISGWLDSSIKNKLGTGLLMGAAICYLILAIQLLVFASKFDGVGIVLGVFLFLLILFAFHVILTIGLLGSFDIVTSITKTWAILLVVTDVWAGLEMFIIFVIFKNILSPVVSLLSSALSVFGTPSFVFFIIFAQLFTIATIFTLKVTDGPKSRLAALIFCVITGMVGGHLFYVGRTKAALVRIIFTITIVLYFVPAIMEIIDFILICCGKFKDVNKAPVVEWIPGVKKQ